MIRPAQPDEVFGIVDLLALTIGGTQRPDQIGSWITNPDRVVLVDSEIRGVILGLNLGSEAEITDVAVAPEHRRQGIGLALVKAFIGAITQRHVPSVFLEVRAGNAAAISLYSGEGFNTVGRRSGYYSDGEDALVLRWEAS